MDQKHVKLIAGLTLFISIVFMFIGLIVSIHILCNIIFYDKADVGNLTKLAMWIGIFALSCYLRVVSGKKLEKNNGAE